MKLVSNVNYKKNDVFNLFVLLNKMDGFFVGEPIEGIQADVTQISFEDNDNLFIVIETYLNGKKLRTFYFDFSGKEISTEVLTEDVTLASKLLAQLEEDFADYCEAL